MRKWGRAALFGVLVLAFLAVNRGSFKSYFSGDEIDNIYWAPGLNFADFAVELVSPWIAENNFRPVGHLYFAVLGAKAGLKFAEYAATLQALHLLNVWLLYLLLRRLQFDFPAAAAGALFFSFEMAVFDAYWKPMYVFDVLCATFCLLALLCYSHRRFVLSFVCFWLAYKAKEPAIVLPLLLAAWEWWFGEKRWRRLIPFFAVSILFGWQAVLLQGTLGDEYRMRFSVAALWKTLSFYSSRVFFLPFAGLATLALPLVFPRDRRIWFGVGGFWLLLAPMLFLPGRLYAAYLYLPLAAFSIAFAAIAANRGLAVIAVFFVLWLPANHWQMRQQRKAALAAAHQNRAWVETAAGFFRTNPTPEAVVIDDVPPALSRWGAESAVRLVSGKPGIEIAFMGGDGARRALDRGSVLVLSWEQNVARLDVVQRKAGETPPAWISAADSPPLWLLGDGWLARNGGHRWIEPRATARLFRPAAARRFTVRVNAGPQLLERVGTSRMELLLNGQPQGIREFSKPGVQDAFWELPAAAPGETAVEFRITPAWENPPDPQRLGIAINSFGFVAQ